MQRTLFTNPDPSKHFTSAQNSKSINQNVVWLGSLSGNPPSPTTNQAYFNTSAGKPYIFDGYSWQFMSQDVSTYSKNMVEENNRMRPRKNIGNDLGSIKK